MNINDIVTQFRSARSTAYDMLESGLTPTFSTGICGFMTAGFGYLNDTGDFEYPLEVDDKGIVPRGIVYRVKSLIEAAQDGDVNIIGHQANCFCVMGSGIAPLIANAFPAAYDVDQATEEGDIDKLGCFTLGIEGDTHVYNLYGQFQPGANTDYKWLRTSLMALRDDLRVRYPDQRVTVGLPKLGAGIGGGDWGVISDIIHCTLIKDDDINVVIYVLDPSEIPSR